jgi:RHS repeat-associated protein
MDNLTYQYEKNSSGQLISNRLRYVHDQVADANYGNDLDNQTTMTLSQVQADNAANSSVDNYYYDPIGNPYTDRKAGVLNMTWTVYGKISAIYKNAGPANSTYYFYDAAGNRTTKSVTNNSNNTDVDTYYVRDAAGNVMSVYTHGTSSLNSGHMTQTEIHLYGSSRLGVLNTSLDVQVPVSAINTSFTRGNKFFELSNHLGNVLVTVSDKKIPVSSNNTSIDYYTADVVSATDYYPFGMQMPNRTYAQANSGYRYGFNGKENDNEVKGQGNEQDYGMRIYDSRVGRFLSVDPLTPKYPELTPYQFASNRPIDGIDQDGLEYSPAGRDQRGGFFGSSIVRDGTAVQLYPDHPVVIEQQKANIPVIQMQRALWRISNREQPQVVDANVANFQRYLRDPDNIGGQAAFDIYSNIHNSKQAYSNGDLAEGTMYALNAGIGTATLSGGGPAHVTKGEMDAKTEPSLNSSEIAPYEHAPIVIGLKLKPTWTPEQVTEGYNKAQAISDNPDARIIRNPPPRQANLRKRFISQGGNINSTQDLDHTLDLQLGGTDAMSNLKGINTSVNRSFGPQINQQTRNMPDGTRVKAAIIVPLNQQSNQR